MSRASRGPDNKMECFAGKKGEFAVWKDKLLTFVKQRDLEYKKSQLEKGQPTPTVLMANFLEKTPEAPAPLPTTGEESTARQWESLFWEQAHTSLLNLLNQSIPTSYLGTLSNAVSEMNPCDVLKDLEKHYGQGDASGTIELYAQWRKALASNWKDLRSLFAQLKNLRGEINRKHKALTGQDMVTESLLCYEVLPQVPSEYWASSISVTAEGFTIEKVESALLTLFGDKSRKEVTQQRQGHPVVVNVVKGLNKKRKVEGGAAGAYSYCFETGHIKRDCPVRAKDQDPNRAGEPLFRTDIKTAPGANKKKKTSSIPAMAVTSGGGNTTEEKTVDEAHQISTLVAATTGGLQGGLKFVNSSLVCDQIIDETSERGQEEFQKAGDVFMSDSELDPTRSVAQQVEP